MNTGKLFLGIDPGQAGGLACLDADGNLDDDHEAMPKTEKEIWGWFGYWQVAFAGRCFAVIESVHAFPGNGVSSMFKFGMGYGGLRMALVAAGIPFEEVTPQAWMKGLGIPSRRKNESKTAWKNRLKGVAQNLFPNEQITLKTCDAILIAEFARRKYNK